MYMQNKKQYTTSASNEAEAEKSKEQNAQGRNSMFNPMQKNDESATKVVSMNFNNAQKQNNNYDNNSSMQSNGQAFENNKRESNIPGGILDSRSKLQQVLEEKPPVLDENGYTVPITMVNKENINVNEGNAVESTKKELVNLATVVDENGNLISAITMKKDFADKYFGNYAQNQNNNYYNYNNYYNNSSMQSNEQVFENNIPEFNIPSGILNSGSNQQQVLEEQAPILDENGYTVPITMVNKESINASEGNAVESTKEELVNLDTVIDENELIDPITISPLKIVDKNVMNGLTNTNDPNLLLNAITLKGEDGVERPIASIKQKDAKVLEEQSEQAERYAKEQAMLKAKERAKKVNAPNNANNIATKGKTSTVVSNQKLLSNMQMGNKFVNDLLKGNSKNYTRGKYGANITEGNSNKNNLQQDIFEMLNLSYQIRVVQNNLYVYSNDQLGIYKATTETELSQMVDSIYQDKANTFKRNLLAEVNAVFMRKTQLQMKFEQFNANDNQINCQNGVINIIGNQIELLPHSPDRYFTYCIKANYIFEETIMVPAFEQFCNTTFKDDIYIKRKLLLQIIGYVVADSMNGKCLLLGIGKPNSGKSILSKLIINLLGEDMVSSVSLEKLGSRFNKAVLANKKANIVSETSGGYLKDIDFIKSFTSGDRVTAEFKGKDPFEFVPAAKLLFFGNTMPIPKDVDPTDGFYNRMIVLHFANSISKERQDMNLLDKLKAESDGIFTLAVREYIELKYNNFTFVKPKDSQEFLESYQQNMNSAKVFAIDMLQAGEGLKAHKKDLVASYAKFCKENGYDVLDKKDLYTNISTQYKVQYSRFRMNGSKALYGYIGVGIKGEDYNE